MMDEYTPLVDLALAMYASEPCRICGRIIELDEVRLAVFAGYNEDSTARAAHKDCWNGMVSVAGQFHNKYGYPVYAVDWQARADDVDSKSRTLVNALIALTDAITAGKG